MLNFTKPLRHERGQSLVILGGALLAFMALLALVVDSGNAYVERRMVQNATDAAALAGGTELAMSDVRDGYYVGGRSDEERIWQTIVNVAEANGIPDTNGVPGDRVNENIRAYYIGPNQERVPGTADLPNNRGIPGNKHVAGIAVETDKAFATFFASLIGFDTLQTAGDSGSLCPPNSGPSSTDGLFPIAVSHTLFQGEGEGRVVDNGPVIGKEYTIFQKNEDSSYGNFGWLTWDSDSAGGQQSARELADDMNDTSRSGEWHIGDWIPGHTGVTAGQPVRDALDNRINQTLDQEVKVPIYDSVRGQGANFAYRIIGFAKFRITEYALPPGNSNKNNGDKWVKGEFVKWVDSSGEPGGAYYGGGTCKLRPPRNPQRSLEGTVYIKQLFPESSPTYSEQHVPVDVMQIVDISGSMNDSWAGGSSKLQSAKDALTSQDGPNDPAGFNEYLQPDEGDRVGLTTFPNMYRSGNYSTPCGYSHDYMYTSQVESGLTGNIEHVDTIINNLNANGGTSLAHAIKAGRDRLLADLHDGSTPVLIVAGDGIVNITLDGEWTGFSGHSGEGEDTPPCNNQAEQQTIDQANLAKEAGIIVFSIAIGDGFNTDVLRSVASPDHDADGDGDLERHFFKATNEQELERIYEYIAQRMETIGQEDWVREQQSVVAGVQVRLENVDTGSVRTVQTNDAGAFAAQDIEPGTYHITARVQINGLWYDILTDGYGGAALDPQYVEVEVGEGEGSTETEVIFLESDDLEQ